VTAELRAALTAAGVPGPYVMVGHSLGGLFALHYARTRPAEVSGLVLVDATPLPLRKLLTPAQWEAFRQTLLQPASPIPGYTVEAYDLTAIVDQIEVTPPSVAPAVLLVAEQVDPIPDPAPPGVPVEALTAVERVRPEAIAQFAIEIPGARLVTVPGTTHYIQIQRPDSVIEAIRSVT
jgi:pimeloyl-ACP methyl ester carboxylesterase